MLILAFAVAAAGTGLFFAYRAARERRRQADYRTALEEGWKEFRDSSDGVVEALANLRAPNDLDILASSARRAHDKLELVAAVEEPRSMKQVAARSRAAADSIGGYLEMVVELSERKDPYQIEERTQVLESRAARARRDFSGLLAGARFLTVNINSDFFLAPGGLAGAFSLPGSVSDAAEMQAVHETMEAFMKASISRMEPEVLWPMVSATLRAFLEAVGTTKEEFARSWRAEWLNGEPEDYYLSSNSITFDSGYAYARAIVYPVEGSPSIKTVRLVHEADGWKVDCYPY